MPVSSPIAWTTVENALYTWLNGSTGLTVIWADQDAPQPAYPYATLKIISGPTRVSQVDEVRQSYDAGQPSEQEVGLETGGPREMTVSVQVFARQSATTPTSHPRDMLSRAQAALGMASYQAALRTAGVAVIEAMAVQDVSLNVDDSWSARAVMNVRFRLSSSVAERVGYIATVDVDPAYTRPDGSAVDPQLHAPFTVP